MNIIVTCGVTVKTSWGAQVKFLEIHPEVDLVGFCTLTAIRCINPDFNGITRSTDRM